MNKYQEALSYLVDKYCDIDYDSKPLNEDTEMVLRLQKLIDKDIPNTNKFSFPNRQQFESLLGKKVKIKLCNKSVLTGELHKTGEEQFKNNSDLYYKPNYYFLLDENGELVDRTVFRVASVRKVEVVENE